MGRKIKNNVIMTDELAGVVDLKKISGARFKEVEYSSLAEKIALDKLFYVRFYYPGGREQFVEARGQTVDKFFPYADGGPLFVDEVNRLEDKKLFEKKTEVMKQLGHRYVAILPGMTELDVRERIS